jgi:hypothetical protein
MVDLGGIGHNVRSKLLKWVQNLNQNSCRALTAVAQPCWSTTLKLVGGRSIARESTAASARRSAAPHPGRSSTGIGVTGRRPDKGSRKTGLEILHEQLGHTGLAS